MTERLHFHFSLSCIGEGNGNPLQGSYLENPRDGEPGGLLSMGSHRVGHNWSDLAAATVAAARSLESLCYLIPTHTLAELCQFDRQSGVFIVARLHYFGCYWSWTVLLFSIYRAVCSCPLPTWTLCYPFFSHWYVIFLYRLTFFCHLSTFPICHWHFGSVPTVFYASHPFDW